MIRELPHYLEFADTRTLLGIPNFWNVVSNLPFLLVALWGLRAFRSKTAFVERLPMTLIFMGLFAAVLGRRRLLWPLVAAGVASVLWWRWSGDLAAYVVVQYVPMLLIPLLLAFRRPRYTASGWMWTMIALYGIAKALELGDRALGGSHAWKHFAVAAAMAAYSTCVSRRARAATARATIPAASPIS